MDESKMYALCEMKDRLISCLKSSMDAGIENVDTHEAYEVADIIKDLAEAEKLCRESEYYKTVTKAMEEGEEPRYGYMETPKRWPRKPYLDQEPYIDAWMNDPRFEENMRMGYSDSMYRDMRQRDPKYSQHNEPRYGTAYNKYSMAKRNYTDTKNPEDKDLMDRSVNEYLSDVMTAVREMWKTADSDVRMRIKNDLTNLVNEMK